MFADDMPQLISFNINHTLAALLSPSHVEIVLECSPLAREDVLSILYEDMRLKTMSSVDQLTDSLIGQICERLKVGPGQFPFGRIPMTPFWLVQGAREAVAVASGYARVITISNTSVFSLDDGCLTPVVEGLAPYLSAMHYSCVLGVAKPDQRIFRLATAVHGGSVETLVHVGSSWERDIVPVLAGGGRAVWVNPGQRHPGSEPIPAGRLLIVKCLADAVHQLGRRWWGTVLPGQARRG